MGAGEGQAAEGALPGGVPPPGGPAQRSVAPPEGEPESSAWQCRAHGAQNLGTTRGHAIGLHAQDGLRGAGTGELEGAATATDWGAVAMYQPDMEVQPRLQPGCLHSC